MAIKIGVLFCFLMFLSYPPTSSAQETAFLLWFLNTDTQLQNAVLIGYDPVDQAVAEEVKLPTQMMVDFAIWSDDRQHILVGAKDEVDYSPDAVDSLCLLNARGEENKCLEISSFTESEEVRLISAAWQAQSHSIFIAIDSPFGGNLQIVSYDVEQGVKTSVDAINIEYTSIKAWQWATNTNRAAIETYDWRTDSFEIYILELQPEVTYYKIDGENGHSPVWSSDENSLVYRVVPSPATTELWVVSWNQTGVLAQHKIEIFEAGDSTPFSTSGISALNQIAWVSYDLHDYPPIRTATLYTALNDDSGLQAIQLGQIEDASVPSALRIDGLSWSPDGNYLVGEVCIGIAPPQCKIGIWTTQSEFTVIETGHAEQTNPIWLPSP